MVPLIAGTVVDKRGAPVPAATIVVITAPAAMPDIALLTGSDGTFALTAPVAGTYRLGVRSDHNMREVDVQVGPSGETGVRVEV